MKHRFCFLFPTVLLFAALLTTRVGAIEIVSSTLPGDTELKLGDSVDFEVVVGGTTETVETSYAYQAWVQGNDFYGNTVFFGLDSGYVKVQGNAILPSGGATAVANLSTTGSVMRVDVDDGGSNYSTPPSIFFSGGGGTGAIAVANLGGSGGVVDVPVSNPGSGYTTPPTVSFTGGGGGGATATANPTSRGIVVDAIRVDGGSNYTATPTVTVSGGGGTGARADATLEDTGSVMNVNFTKFGSGYTTNALPTVTFTGGGGGVGAEGTVELSDAGEIYEVTTTNSWATPIGSGFTSAPKVNFVGGGATRTAQAVAYLTGDAISFIEVIDPGSGYTSQPTITFSGGGGSVVPPDAAIAVRSFSIARVNMTSGGSGYSAAPTPVFTGGTGSGAEATTTLGRAIKRVNVTEGGSGYTSQPTITFSGGGGSVVPPDAAIAVRSFSIARVNMTSGGSGYSAAPTPVFTGGTGSGAEATSTLGRAVKSLTITARGSGYTSNPTFEFNGGGGGTGASFTAVRGFGVQSITVTSPGSGYTVAPTVSFSGDGESAAATALIGLSIESITITNGGSGYTTAPTVTFSSGSAQATAVLGYKVASVDVTNGGEHYVNAPPVIFSGGGGSGAVAISSIGGGAVTAVSVTDGGKDYTSAPAVAIGDGGFDELKATTAKINGKWTVPGDGTLPGGYQLKVAIYAANGNGAKATATIAGGEVTDVTIDDGGIGYKYAPYVNFITPSSPTQTGSGAAGKAAVNTNTGVVTGVTIDQPGSAYDPDPPIVQFSDFPNTKASLASNLGLPLQLSGTLSVTQDPNIGAGPCPELDVPAVTFQAGNYMGGDVIRFTVKWVNGKYDVTTGTFGNTRPLSEADSDDYISDLRLTTNPEFGDANNDDFLLSRYVWSADVRGIPNGSSVVRKVVVNQYNPSSQSLPGYGIPGVDLTARVYLPQPDDAYLDIGESVETTIEQIIPQNFSGSYFVAMRMTLNGDPDASNDTFVSNQANKFGIFTTASPLTEPASAVSTENGTFVAGGDAASDFSSISEDGNYIAFASRASNLLALPGGGTYQVTSGQQIFLKLRQSREVVLASSTVVGTQANADCFNPSISADGRYIAYDSIASNIVSGAATGGRSMIYVFDTQSYTTAIVSKSAAGVLANGDSFRPRMSQSGRFVVFQSLARNLDAARPLPTTNRSQQIYMYDRDVDGNGVFDESGNIATYLVSINDYDIVANGWCQNPVVNLDDAADAITVNSGMHVAYTSYAANLAPSTGNAMVYRVSVTPGTGPDAGSVIPVSINDWGAPSANVDASKDENGTSIVPNADEAAISGDGSQVAFTCGGNNLVFNPNKGEFTPTYPTANPTVIPGGDYNRVPDIFVRDLVNGRTVRVSESRERVATGTITFYASSWNSENQPGGDPYGNEPYNLPEPGDYLLISDGTQTIRFVFGTGTDTPTTKYVTIEPSDVTGTRWNLYDKISAAGSGQDFKIAAQITNPPEWDASGQYRIQAYRPSIYLYNETPGIAGNQTMGSYKADDTPSEVVIVSGMGGGGTQAISGYMQGVPFGSNEPSIDRSGRFVAFRSIAYNLDVHEATAQNTYTGTPATGELIRPLIFNTSNVFLHDREADGDPASGFDAAGNTTTTRVSLNNFGYKTWIDSTEEDGINSTKSANNNRPAVSADGRFVTFSSDAMGEGGLIFGPNNLTPLDNDNVKDVFVYDRRTPGSNPTVPNTAPVVSISSPVNGLQVVPGTQIAVSATATPSSGKIISSVELFVNNISQGKLTSTPFTWNYSVSTAGTYSIVVVATDSRGITGMTGVSVTAYQPQVPTDPAAGSNEKFVVDYFQKIFLRAPTYAEYADYLSLLTSGLTQAEVIQAMMESDTYTANENVLFGYYLRMGIAPTNKSAFQTILENMTSGTNATLLPSTMSAGVSGVPNLPPSPYGATFGQALAAQTLINQVPNAFNARLVRNLAPTNFVDWTWRTFNQPYLPQSMSQSSVASMGSKGDILATIANYPTTNSRYGATYAFMSALYANMPLANVANTTLRTTLASFDGQVKGLAVNYLLTPTNTWATNTGPLTTAMISNLLPPVITNSGTNTIPINVLYSNAIGGQNLFTNTVYYGSNLPTGIVATNIGGTGYIVGTPTASGTNTAKIFASNGPGLVGSNTVKFVVLPPPPTVLATTYAGTVGEPFSATLQAQNSPTNFAIISSPPALPPGLTLNLTNGVISGVPTAPGTATNRIAAYNRGGSSSANIVFKIDPAFTAYAAQYNLTGANAAPSADPDGDGHSNAKEFAFGMDPTKPDSQPVKVESANGKVTVTWVRRKNTLITYTVQSSPALSGASAAWGAVTPAPAVQVLGDVNAEYERVKAEITMSGSTRFYRVEAFLPSGAL